MLIKSRLDELEEIVKEGLEKFVLVGNALKEIKDNKLYEAEYETFEAYCRAKFQIGESRAYQLIRSSNITQSLTADILPSRASHVNKLSIIKSDNYRNDAWDEVVETSERMGVDIKADLVESFAQKYYVLENDPSIGADVISGKITPAHGFKLVKTLRHLPEYYRELVLLYGTSIETDALIELQTLETEFEDEFKDLVSSGWLMGRYNIEFKNLTKRDVQTHLGRLYWERKQERIEVASEIQSEGKSGLAILSGIEIAEKMVEYKDDQVVIYAFPEKEYSPKQLADFIDKNGYGIMYLALYSKNEPNVNFGNTTIKPSMINGVKPQYMIDSFNKTIG